MKIFIDSNIFIKDFSINSPYFGALRNSIRSSVHTLHVPSLVVDEVVNKYGERYREYLSTIRELGFARIPGILKGGEIQKLKVAIQIYREFLIEELSKMGAQFLPYPITPHEELVQRALCRQKPFRSSDTGGYRDVLIWKSIIAEIASDLSGTFILLTNNTHDFAKSKTDLSLHPDLIVDLKEIGVDPSKLIIFKDLRTLAEQYLIPELEELEDTGLALSMGTHSQMNLIQIVEEQLVDAIGYREFESYELGIPSEFETTSLSWIEGAEEITNVDVRKLSDAEILISFGIEAEASFDVFIRKYDYYGLDENIRPGIIDSDWNETYMLASFSAPVNIDVNLVVVSEDWSNPRIELDDLKVQEKW